MKFLKTKAVSGQMAIFFALIFQVLFLMFAMVINIGLLVHHKINLQNSVDLAAYYGAAKQSETLNAIAHINFQIRQSWKLLTWRYRVLGMGGDQGNDMSGSTSAENVAGNPYRISQKALFLANERPLEGLEESEKNANIASAFCISYQPFQPNPPDESLCLDTLLKTTDRISLFQPPPVIAGFIGLSSVARALAMQSLAKIKERCKSAGEKNYVMLARYAASYAFDQADRKQTIVALAKLISEKTDDFKQIDGGSAREGMINTLKNNLSIANRESITDNAAQIKIFNALAHDQCNSSGVPQGAPPKFLSEIMLAPAFFFLDSKCPNDAYVREIRYLSAANIPYNRDNLDPEIQELSKYVDPLSPPFNASVGFEKNPWCMSYIRMEATTAPKIPFSPLGDVKLKAVAYAKPFGGRLGPWYHKNWQPQSPTSQGGPNDRIDQMLPPRIIYGGQIADPKDVTRVPNYSRFPGDKLGIISRNTRGRFTRLLYGLGSASTNRNPQWQQAPQLTYSNDQSPHYDQWSHIADISIIREKRDTLAWGMSSGTSSAMRDLEIAAIAPDLFDITYYSIEPDFYNNYYKGKLNKIFLEGSNPFLLRLDHGGRLNEEKRIEEFGVKDQIDILKKLGNALETNVLPDDVGYKAGLTYFVSDPAHVLTSWIGKDLADYDLDETRFGKCLNPPTPEEPNPGNCVVGGRTGFSVKLVSEDFINASDLRLGGDGASTGAIKNPPP
ncbi:MAG: TadE/TadG family type IV pilus assembly protein [Pseudobdellovibrionaceae bacterium]